MTGAATMPRPTPLANAQWLAGREVGPRRPGLHGQGVASGEPISCKKAWPDIPGRLSGCIKAPILSLSLFLGLALAQSFGAEPPPAGGMEQRLRTAIAQIKAIDNHAHPQAVATAVQPDLDFDQLASPVDDFPLPVRLRPDNPELLQAWRDLFGYAHQDFLPEHLAELKAQRAKVMAEKGLLFPAWVLGKIGTETMLANRVAMGPGLAAPAFRWVAFVDALAMPLDHTALAEATPDRTIYYEDIQRLSQRYLAALGLKALPPTLAGYLKEVVNPTLARLKATGAVGIKFEAAYLRSLAFADVLESRAAEIYAAHLAGRPAAAEDTALQDYLDRYLAREAGRNCRCRSMSARASVGICCNKAPIPPSSSPCSRTSAAAKPSSFCSTELGPTPTKSPLCSASPTSMRTFPPRPSCSIPLPYAGVSASGCPSSPRKCCSAQMRSRPDLTPAGKSSRGSPPIPVAKP